MNIEELSQEWVAATEAYGESSKDQHRAIGYIIDLPFEEKYDELWSFIKCTYNLNLQQNTISNLAAGPLEDLLAYAGENYIEEVEALSNSDPKFKYLLGGVWQNKMSEALWLRVCKARGVPW